ncbi:DUF4913 domain-containing protein [Streptomyces globisporus]|uniref:DUF4913 domain-containing protein n=1 Tax=Streptomyces globisporus TaxID=1908 RepID=UPI0038271A5F
MTAAVDNGEQGPPSKDPDGGPPATEDEAAADDENGAGADDEKAAEPSFILYLEGERYAEAMQALTLWVHHLLLPVYGRETVSARPWCPRWWEHLEAVAQLYGLWMSWQHYTGIGSDLGGPTVWHRDCLGPVMLSLRDPAGPFAGCKPGSHRAKPAPEIDTPD